MEPSAPTPPPAKPRLHRAPLVAPAAAMVLGIVCGRHLPLPLGLWVVLGVAALALAAILFHREHLRQACAAAAIVAIFAFAASYVRWLYSTIPADDVVNYTASLQTLATLEGRIITSPQIVADDPESNLPYQRSPRTTFILDCEAIQSPRGPLPASGLARVTVDEPAARLAAGQHVRIDCWLGRFEPPRNPGQFDQQAWSRQNHTLVWASVPTADGVAVLDAQPQNRLQRAYWRLRASLRQHLDGLGEGYDGHLVNALIIGERHKALDSLNQAMMKAGVAHYLSISGSHMAIFLGFFYLLCRILALTARRAAAAVLIVLAAYMLMAEPSPPLLRSAIMAGAVALAVLAGRGASTLNALAAAAIVLLIADPMDLFSASFQLSFGIVLGLVLLTGPMRRRLFGRFLLRRGLMVFRQDQRFARWMNFQAADWAMTAAAVSLSAFVVSAPLAAYHFGMFSPYAGLLTLLLALPVTMVLVSGYISLALLGPMPNLSDVFGNIAAWSANLLDQCVRWSQALPGLCLPMRPVSVGWVLLCYTLVGLVMLRRRIPLGRVWIALVSIILAAWTVQSQLPAPPPNKTEIHVLAVGAGQCVLLHSPAGQTYLFDAGTRSSFDAYRSVLAPFLRERRLPAPSAAFVSHANADHYNALIGLLPQTPLHKIYLNPFFGLGPHSDEPLARLLQEIDQRHVQVVRLHAGDEIDLDPHVRVQVLWPPAQLPAKVDINDTSLVLRVTCDGNSILIPGDAAALAEEGLMKNPQALKSDVLIMPHHGSVIPLPERFVQCVDPRVIVISNSHDPAPSDPTKYAAGFYNRLRQSRQCYCTWKDGCILIRMGYGKVEVEPEK